MSGPMVGVLDHHDRLSRFAMIVGRAVFPDYFYPPAKEWWKNQIIQYHQKIRFDALWIDMK